MHILSRWFKEQFSNPQVVFLTIGLIICTSIVIFFGDILMPIFSAIVIAYILEGMVKKLEATKMPRILAVSIVWIFLIFFILTCVFWLLPLLYKQVSELITQAPSIINKTQIALLELPKRYPELITTEQVQEIFKNISSQISVYGQNILSFSLSYFRSLLTLLILIVLIPVLVFFFLKDKQLIFAWFTQFIPKDNQLTEQILHESNLQVSNYIRGKMLEITIVGLTSIVVFEIFGLPYATLLGVMVGLSVIIPLVGAAVVTFPVIIIAWFHWGWGVDLLYISIAYLIIQALDGNVLVPILFSEVVNLHPVAIIVAIVFFGGVWGLWGVFFAIPLATLIQAIIKAWPKVKAAELN